MERCVGLADGHLRIASGALAHEIRLGRGVATLDGERLAFTEVLDGASGEVLELGGKRHRIRAARQGDRVFVWCDGEVYEFVRAPAAGGHGGDRGDLLAPMPGRIQKTFVSEGEAVQRGQVLLVLEAMKMEHTIRAPRDGTVRRLPHAEGELVETGTALVELA